MQEQGFEFDDTFRDFKLDNPLMEKHREFDAAAMREHGLTPDRYNRCAPCSILLLVLCYNGGTA